MLTRSLKRLGNEQAGLTLIEVLVSALVLVTVSSGTFIALTAGNRATAQERHRAKANDLAEQELERVRSLRIGDLSNWNSTRRVLEDGTELASGVSCPATGQICYTIVSTTQFLNEPAGTSTCAAGTGSRDYLQLRVSVTWAGMGPLPPITAVTNISPPSGSLVPNSGSLLVEVDDANSNGLSGVTLTGTGAGSFSGTTGATGCVLWRNLPAGNYTMTAGGVASGMVDTDGNPPTGQTVSIVDQGTNTVTLQYDRPGSIPVSFTTRRQSDNALVSVLPTGQPVKADSLIVFNSGMTTGPKRFGTPGTLASTITATGLFPFASPDSVYAGICQSSTVAGSAVASVNVPAGGSQAAVVQLPALHLNVYQGATTASGKAVGATVTVEDLLCPNNPTAGFKRTFTTNSSGQLDNPGLPMSDYRVCATMNVPGIGNRKIRTGDTAAPANLSLDDPADLNSPSTTLDLLLQGAGSTSGSTCP